MYDERCKFSSPDGDSVFLPGVTRKITKRSVSFRRLTGIVFFYWGA